MRELPNRVFPTEVTEDLDNYIKTVLPDTPRVSDFLSEHLEDLSPGFWERHREKLSIFQESLNRDYVVGQLGTKALMSEEFDFVTVYFRSIASI